MGYRGQDEEKRFMFQRPVAQTTLDSNLPEEPFTSRGFRSIFGYPQDEIERCKELSACLSPVIRDEFADGAFLSPYAGKKRD